MAHEQHTIPWVRREWVFLAAVLVGAWLRLDQISTQIIADDEWHALIAINHLSTFDIVRHFGFSDSCIPLTLWYKLASLTIGVSEWVMRAPVLAVGLISLVVFPLLVRRHHGARVATIFAWLLAISPIDVYLDRYARPYAIALFFTFVGTMAFYAFWAGGRRSWKWIYIGCAVCGPYFHLTTLPLVLLPIGLAIASRVVLGSGRSAVLGSGRSLDRPTWADLKVGPSVRVISQRALRDRDLVVIVAGVVAGLAIVLGPPLWSDWIALKVKMGQRQVQDAGFLLGLQLLWGAGVLWPLAGGLTALGALVLFWRDQVLWAFLLLFLVVQVAVLALTRPVSIEDGIVVARYALSSLPVLLWLMALALSAIGDRLRPIGRMAAAVPPVAWIAAAGAAGPLPHIHYSPNNWTNHGVFQYFPYLDPASNRYVTNLQPATMPAFYAQLGAQAANHLRLLEAPWYYEWHHNPYPFYQRVHRQQTFIGFVDDGVHASRRSARGQEIDSELPLSDGRFQFRRFIHVLDQPRLCEARIDRVIFHKDLRREIRPAIDGRALPIVLDLIVTYRQRYGAPIYDDDLIVVFDVSRACGA